jgi:hypothetical protein
LRGRECEGRGKGERGPSTTGPRTSLPLLRRPEGRGPARPPEHVNRLALYERDGPHACVGVGGRKGGGGLGCEGEKRCVCPRVPHPGLLEMEARTARALERARGRPARLFARPQTHRPPRCASRPRRGRDRRGAGGRCSRPRSGGRGRGRSRRPSPRAPGPKTRPRRCSRPHPRRTAQPRGPGTTTPAGGSAWCAKCLSIGPFLWFLATGTISDFAATLCARSLAKGVREGELRPGRRGVGRGWVGAPRCQKKCEKGRVEVCIDAFKADFPPSPGPQAPRTPLPQLLSPPATVTASARDWRGRKGRTSELDHHSLPPLIIQNGPGACLLAFPRLVDLVLGELAREPPAEGGMRDVCGEWGREMRAWYVRRAPGGTRAREK